LWFTHDELIGWFDYTIRIEKNIFFIEKNKNNQIAKTRDIFIFIFYFCLFLILFTYGSENEFFSYSRVSWTF